MLPSQRDRLAEGVALFGQLPGGTAVVVRSEPLGSLASEATRQLADGAGRQLQSGGNVGDRLAEPPTSQEALANGQGNGSGHVTILPEGVKSKARLPC